jgi:hypothetical protein
MFDRDRCVKAIAAGNYEWKKHTLQRMAERDVLQTEIIEVVLQGELITTYDKDRPFPSALFFKIVNRRPLHVAVAIDKENSFASIITVYEPSIEIFETDFKTKRKLK